MNQLSSMQSKPDYSLLPGFALCLSLFLAFTGNKAFAWDSVGHRLTAAVALEFISTETREELLAILAEHPRYQEDFLDRLPGFINANDQEERALWLLGQAAYWPDIARGLPGSERRRYNRPPWHYIDGAWIRGSAMQQGNLYVGIDSFANIEGEAATTIRSENDVHNVVTGIDYNTSVLSDASHPASERAVALCWVLHLMGDIHQPMHTGSLYSAHSFSGGDLGGNRIPVSISGQNLNLHAAWDRALRQFGMAESLPIAMQQVAGFSTPRIEGVASDWTAWMSESRQLLISVAYTPGMLEAAREADEENLDEIEQPIPLSDSYVSTMQQLARQRLGLAGLRLAIWFENNLP